LADPRILVPGDPERSLIYRRMKMEGLGRMPHVASSVVDQEAIATLRAWIIDLGKRDRSGGVGPLILASSGRNEHAAAEERRSCNVDAERLFATFFRAIVDERTRATHP
jgi:hypothetical protein